MDNNLLQLLQQFRGPQPVAGVTPPPPGPYQTTLGYVDPARLQGAFTDENGEPIPYATVGGAQLGLDNNYQYAVYPDGHVEHLFQGNDPTYDPNTASGAPLAGSGQARSASELAAQGVDFSNVARDAHGVPQFNFGGLDYAGQPQGHITGENGFFGALPGAAFSTMANYIVPGAGSIAAAGMTEGSIGDKARAAALSYGLSEGIGAAVGGFGDAPVEPGATPATGAGPTLLADSGSTVSDVGGGYGATPAPSWPASMMPAAVPEVDPTFGGQLSPAGPGVFATPSSSTGITTQPDTTSDKSSSTTTGESTDTGVPSDTGSTADTGGMTPDPATGGLTFNSPSTGSIDAPVPDPATGGLSFSPSAAEISSGGATLGGGGGGNSGLGTDFEDIARGYEQSQADTLRSDVAGVPSANLDWDKVGNALSKYGPLALGTAGLVQGRNAGHAAADQLKQVGADQRAVADELIANWRSGKISAADAHAIEEWERGAIAQTRQYYANAKQSDSSQAVEAESRIHARAEAMRQGSRDALLKQGMDALNVTDRYQAAAIQAEYGADQQMLANALQFMNVYGSWLRTMNPQKTTGTVQSTTSRTRNDALAAGGDEPSAYPEAATQG